MADELRLLSNGYGFYEALSVPARALCKPQTAPVHYNIQYHPELKIEFDQFPITRFFSPGEFGTPPGTPAGIAPPPPPLPPPSTTLCRLAQVVVPDFFVDWRRPRAHRGLHTERELVRSNASEPLVGDADVPTCAQLLARPGESVHRCFVDIRKDWKGKSVDYCTACGFMRDLARSAPTVQARPSALCVPG